MSTDNKNIADHASRLEDHFVTRRSFLQRAEKGFGALSMAALFGEDIFGWSNASAAEQIASLLPREPHFAAKAKHVVHIFAQGAPWAKMWTTCFAFARSEE